MRPEVLRVAKMIEKYLLLNESLKFDKHEALELSVRQAANELREESQRCT